MKDVLKKYYDARESKEENQRLFNILKEDKEAKESVIQDLIVNVSNSIRSTASSLFGLVDKKISLNTSITVQMILDGFDSNTNKITLNVSLKERVYVDTLLFGKVLWSTDNYNKNISFYPSSTVINAITTVANFDVLREIYQKDINNDNQRQLGAEAILVPEFFSNDQLNTFYTQANTSGNWVTHADSVIADDVSKVLENIDTNITTAANAAKQAFITAIDSAEILATAGAFTLSIGSIATDPISFNAGPAEIQAALNDKLGTDMVSVKNNANNSGWIFTFDASLGDVDSIILSGFGDYSGTAVVSISTSIVDDLGSSYTEQTLLNPEASAETDLSLLIANLNTALATLDSELNENVTSTNPLYSLVQLERLHTAADVQLVSERNILSDANEVWTNIPDASAFTALYNFALQSGVSWNEALAFSKGADFTQVALAYTTAEKLAKTFNDYKSGQYSDFRSVYRNILKFETAVFFLDPDSEFNIARGLTNFNFDAFKTYYKII